MKLSCRQLDQAQSNPKEVAKMLMNPKVIKGGFNKVTYEVCYQLAKGQVTYKEAKYRLEVRLSEDFKDTAKNRKRRASCQRTLDCFYEFVQEEGLVCILNYSNMHVPLVDGHIIAGQSCAIFRNSEGQGVGVVITDTEYDFGSTLRIPLEQYWISKKLQLNAEDDVIIYVYNTTDQSYQSVSYHWDKIEYMLEKANKVIGNVVLEMERMAS